MGLSELRRTIRDRQRMEEQSQSQLDDSPAMRQLINRCYNVPFYYWGKTSHHSVPTNCNQCFNCIIGLPRKGNQEFPLFDYEHMLYRSLMEPGFLNTRKKKVKKKKSKKTWTIFNLLDYRNSSLVRLSNNLVS